MNFSAARWHLYSSSKGTTNCQLPRHLATFKIVFTENFGSVRAVAGCGYLATTNMAGDTFSELGSLLLMMMMAHSSQTRIVRKVDGQYLHARGGCRDRFLMRTSYRTLDRRRFGMRMVVMLLALSASCVFHFRLYVSLPRTHTWLFSLMSASCLSLRPLVVMNDG